MHSFTSLLLAAGLAVQATSAAKIVVAVGKDGLTFEPPTFAAAIGDVVEYHYYPKNHSVVQGDFSSGCTPAKAGGFFSGFMPVAVGPGPNVFQVTITTTDPIPFYCSQNTGSHCKNGMFGIINPSGNSSMDAYGALAKAASIAVSPPTIGGGVIASLNGTTATTTGSSSSASTTATTTTSGSSSSSSGASTSSGSGSVPVSGAGMLKAGMGAVAGAVGVAALLM